MNKRGAMRIREENLALAMERAEEYLKGYGSGRIVKYRTVRPVDVGVVVNEGEKVIIWNAYSGRFETYGQTDFQNRVIPN